MDASGSSRRAAPMTVGELANRTGLSREAIRELEAGV
jgi:hypothetical protein